MTWNCAPEAAEPVIAEDDQQRPVVDVGQDLADDLVAAAVMLLDRPGEPRVKGLALVGRVVGLAEPPEHVLDAVRRVVEAVEEAFAEPIELVEHHGPPLAPGVLALGQEGLLAEPLVRQAVVVLDHARGVEHPEPLGELAGEFRRRADREERGLGVEVDGRGVELEGRAPSRTRWKRTMPWTDWSGPSLNLTRSQSLQAPCRTASSLGEPLERTITRPACWSSESVISNRASARVLRMARADQVGRDRAVAVDLDRDDLLALARGYRGIGAVERGGAEAAAEVGDAHAREHRARAARSGGYVQGQRRMVEAIPAAESRSQTGVPRRRFTAFGGEQDVLLLVPVQAVVGQVGLRVAAEEVEDAVAAGVHPRGEGRPGDGRLGRGRRRHPCESARGDQLRQIRQLSGRQHRLDEARLEPVQADHDDSLRHRPASRAVLGMSMP